MKSTLLALLFIIARLWATAHISMIPVYEAYKEKGFTVVGVAHECNPKRHEKYLSQR